MKWVVTFKSSKYLDPETITFFAENFWQATQRVIVAMKLMGFSPEDCTVTGLEKA